MKVIPFEELPFIDFVMKNIEVIYQSPDWSFLDNRHGIPRPLNGFLLIEHGKCDYVWQNGEASLERASLIYLPTGCQRLVRVTEREFSFWRICFRLFDASDGEEIVFSREPFLVTDAAGQGMYELCERLFRTTMTPTQNFSSMAGLCEFFSQMRTLGDCAKKSRVSIAVDYLNSHYIENTEIAALASMCYLSEPQFYRLFRREVGQTPIEYRNRLRIDRACSLLLDGECSIGEIASMLGFASLYYFSRTFKQLTGKSPTAYKTEAYKTDKKEKHT